MNNARPNGKNSTEAIHTKLDSYAQMNEALKDRLYKSSHDESIQSMRRISVFKKFLA